MRVPTPTPDRLKTLRRDKNLTQTDIARLVWTTLRTIQHWESGDTRIDLARWELLLIKLNILPTKDGARYDPESASTDR